MWALERICSITKGKVNAVCTPTSLSRPQPADTGEATNGLTATPPGPTWAPKGQGQPSVCLGSGWPAHSPARGEQQNVV